MVQFDYFFKERLCTTEKLDIKYLFEAYPAFDSREITLLTSNVTVSVHILRNPFRGGRGQGADCLDYARRWGSRIGQKLIA